VIVSTYIATICFLSDLQRSNPPKSWTDRYIHAMRKFWSVAFGFGDSGPQVRASYASMMNLMEYIYLATHILPRNVIQCAQQFGEVLIRKAYDVPLVDFTFEQYRALLFRSLLVLFPSMTSEEFLAFLHDVEGSIFTPMDEAGGLKLKKFEDVKPTESILKVYAQKENSLDAYAGNLWSITHRRQSLPKKRVPFNQLEEADWYSVFSNLPFSLGPQVSPAATNVRFTSGEKGMGDANDDNEQDEYKDDFESLGHGTLAFSSVDDDADDLEPIDGKANFVKVVPISSSQLKRLGLLRSDELEESGDANLKETTPQEQARALHGWTLVQYMFGLGPGFRKRLAEWDCGDVARERLLVMSAFEEPDSLVETLEQLSIPLVIPNVPVISVQLSKRSRVSLSRTR